MDFQFSREQDEFRQEVRDFLKGELPEHWMNGELYSYATEDEEDWALQKQLSLKLGGKGWLSMWWPKEYGGQERSRVDYGIFREESFYYGGRGYDAVGGQFVAPTLLGHGSEEQKRNLLPSIAKGEVFWCEFLSEPDAGSDMASLNTRAVADGDYYIVNGQKAWDTNAHHAGWSILLARTDTNVPKHKGLSMFVVDKHSPGISLVPRYNLVGERAWSDVFFDDVKVPKENLIGGENKGWQVVLTTLNNERSIVYWLGTCRRNFDNLLDFVKENETLRNNPVIQNKIASLATEIQTARLLSYHTLWRQDNGLDISYQVSMEKTYIDRLLIHLTDAIPEILGLYGQIGKGSLKWAPFDGSLESASLMLPSWRLANGSDEIEKIVVATLGLGLAR